MARFFLDDVWYFITVPTTDHEPIFYDLQSRGVLLEQLIRGLDRFDLKKHHFSIMSDHYHLLIDVREGLVVPKLLNYVNGGASFQLRLNRPATIWGKYHLYIPPTEEVLGRVTGYVVGNPMKHGDVGTFDELYSWPFSSFALLVGQVGGEQAEEMVSSTIPLEDFDFSLSAQPLQGRRD
ncbi:MAG: transposase [Candidatus Uhrbacteria bacterium]|nr:transposase [Candidatus Uhrbacteria bacterium]